MREVANVDEKNRAQTSLYCLLLQSLDSNWTPGSRVLASNLVMIPRTILSPFSINATNFSLQPISLQSFSANAHFVQDLSLFSDLDVSYAIELHLPRLRSLGLVCHFDKLSKDCWMRYLGSDIVIDVVRRHGNTLRCLYLSPWISGDECSGFWDMLAKEVPGLDTLDLRQMSFKGKGSMEAFLFLCSNQLLTLELQNVQLYTIDTAALQHGSQLRNINIIESSGNQDSFQTLCKLLFSSPRLQTLVWSFQSDGGVTAKDSLSFALSTLVLLLALILVSGLVFLDSFVVIQI